MKVLMVCDQYPLPPRLVNMRNSILAAVPDAQVDVVAWNRSGVEVKESYVFSLDSSIGYGNQMKKLFRLPEVLEYVKEILKKEQYNVVHSIDFEMMFVASLCKAKQKLIYEVYDIKFFGNKIFNFGRTILEKWSIKRKVDGIIYASPYFGAYYDSIVQNLPPAMVINNKPQHHAEFEKDSGFMDPYKEEIGNRTVVSFIGLIRYPEILKNLMVVIAERKDEMVLLLAGDGPDKAALVQYSKEIRMSNIICTGRFKSRDLQSIYSITDIVWAAYPNDDQNVYYAVSNKFFESQVFMKKIIVSERTLLGQDVVRKGIGVCVDPYSVESIAIGLNNVNELQYPNRRNKDCFWQDEEHRIRELYVSLL